MDKIKELTKQLKDIIKYLPTCCLEIQEEFYKYSKVCELVNTVADLSSNKIARALDYTIKEIAYTSVEPNLEVREKYLIEAVKDLAAGMDEVDVLLKYDDMLYKCKGWL